MVSLSKNEAYPCKCIPQEGMEVDFNIIMTERRKEGLFSFDFSLKTEDSKNSLCINILFLKYHYRNCFPKIEYLQVLNVCCTRLIKRLIAISKDYP